MTGHETRLLTEEEANDGRHLFRLADAPHRSVFDEILIGLGCHALLGHLGLDQPRQDTVHAHVVLCPGDTCRANQRDHGGLGSRIRHQRRARAEGRGGRNGDDPAELAFDHLVFYRVDHVEGAVEVDLHAALPGLPGHVVGRFDDSQAGRVSEQIDGTERLTGGGDDGPGVIGPGDVSGSQHGGATGGLDLFERLPGVFFTRHVVDGDTGALGGKTQ